MAVAALAPPAWGDAHVRRILTWFGPSAVLAAVAIQPLEGCSGNGAASSGGRDASAPPGESGAGGSSSGGSSGGAGQLGSSSGEFSYEAGPTGSSSGGSSGGSSSGAGGSSGGNPLADVDAAEEVAACVTITPSDGLQTLASPASGTVTGNGLDALLCPGGAVAFIECGGSGDGIATPCLFFFSLTLTGAASFQFLAPTDASSGDVTATLGMGSASPGSYSSPAGSQCGTVAFGYSLPVPPGVDCEGGAAPDCPPGCGNWVCPATFSPNGCSPCLPLAPSVSYLAQGTTDCEGDTSTAVGSWTLSLTSVTEADAGGLAYYAPHGTLTATMVNAGDAGADGATLSVTF